MIEIENEILIGEIINIENEYYFIKCESNVIKAKKAFSFLIKPLEKDIVILTKHKNNLYITNILDRKYNGLELEFKEHTTIKANILNIYISKLDSYIDTIKSFFNIFDLNGVFFSLKTTNLKTLTKSNENICVDMVNKIDRRTTYINKFDELQCKNSRELIEDNKIIKAKNIIASAKDQVKIDGENIHLA